MKKLLCSLLLAVMVAAGGAPKEIIAVKTDVRPVIDGKIDDAVWEKAEWQDDFSVLENHKTPAQRTRFKVLTDRMGIYLAVSCVDSEVKTQVRAHDGPVWHDDCVEIFLVPEAEISDDPNIREFYQFIVNASGSRYEQYNVGGVGNNNWNAPWQAASRITDVGWDTEIFIPFSSIDLKAGQGGWRFNLVRNDRGVRSEICTWSRLSKLQDPAGFGYLKGLEIDYQRYGAEITEMDLTVKPVENKTVAVVQAAVKYQPRKSISLKCALTMGEEIKSLTSKDVVMPESGEVQMEIPTAVAESGEYCLKLYITDADGVIKYREERKSVNIAPLQVVMVKPFYRRMIMSKQADKNVVFKYNLVVAPDQLELAVRVVDSFGKVLMEESRREMKAEDTFTFDAAKLPPDKYRVEFKLAKGKESLGDFAMEFQVAPPVENEIWLNERRQVVINGEPWFARGFIGGSPGIFSLARKYGYNFIQIYTLNRQDLPVILKTLDEAQANNLKLAFSPLYKTRRGFFDFTYAGKTTKKLTPEIREKMVEMVNAVKDHPALLGWYLYDEPRGADFSTQLKIVYDLLREIDPHHPVLGLDNTAMGCINKTAHCDIHLLDMYPSPRVSSGNNKPISEVFRAVKLMDGTLKKEGVWYVPQAFDRDSFSKEENDHRAPTYQETRCAIYSTIVAGATGIAPYKIGNPEVKYFQRNSNSGIFASPEMKIGFLDGMGPEMQAMSPVYLAETVQNAVTPGNADIKVMVKKYNGKYFILAVNPTAKEIKTGLKHSLSVKAWKVLCEERSIKGSTIDDLFVPHAVHIYTDALDFADPVNIYRIRQMIDAELKAIGR